MMPDLPDGLQGSRRAAFSDDPLFTEPDLRVMERVAQAPVAPPPDLLDTLLTRLPPVAPRAPAWRSGVWAAAAVFLLSLGGGTLLGHFVAPPSTAEAIRTPWAEDLEEEGWSIAGAPLLEGLSDQTLAALLIAESP